MKEKCLDVESVNSICQASPQKCYVSLLRLRLCMQVYKLNPERLYATYFEGDAKQGLEPDNEAREIWCTARLAQLACHGCGCEAEACGLTVQELKYANICGLYRPWMPSSQIISNAGIL